MAPLILSLCDYSGAWSQPYLDAGYRVVRVDPKHSATVDDGSLLVWRGTVSDVLASYRSLGPVHGILAAPPCTDFSLAGVAHWTRKDLNGSTAKSVQIVLDVLHLVVLLRPRWWALENPRGRIRQLVPQLGKPSHSFHPCDYGDPYKKRTLLWGRFTPPLPLFLGQIRSCHPSVVASSWVENVPGSGAARQAARSKTPSGFASAFFEVNP